MTLWIHTLQGREMSRDSDDHSLMHDLADELDALCLRLGVAKLSSFFDLTDMQYNLGEEPGTDDEVMDFDEDAEPALDAETGYAYGIDDMQWFDAATGLAALQALRSEIDASAGAEMHLSEEQQDVLLAELDDCIMQLIETAAQGGRFHLAVLL